MKNGQAVASFEKVFAEFVGARFAIAMVNGTATLHSALVALGVKPGDRVATTPLTMSATSIAILQAGAVPVYRDVDEKTWLMKSYALDAVNLPVSLYGLNTGNTIGLLDVIDDAAQTLRRHSGAAFTSYSFQSSKILSLGEGGMLTTNSEALAESARSFSSLGYKMKADQPRIDANALKSPKYERHHLPMSFNYRMNDVTADLGLEKLHRLYCAKGQCAADMYLDDRRIAASLYREAFAGCSWASPQFVPEGFTHDYWAYTVALESEELWAPFVEAVVKNSGEQPYGAWRITYHEPAFRHLSPYKGTLCDKCGHNGWIDHNGRGWRCERCFDPKQVAFGCGNAEDLQPRLVQFQTNNLESAEKNAKAVKRAIEDVSGRHDLIPPFYTRAKPHGIPTGDYYATDKNFWGDATGTPCS